MDLVSPVLLSTKAFDATKDKTFSFMWRGNQAFGSLLVVRNNVTNAIVASHMSSSMRLEHTLPANLLSNGVCYNATLFVLGANSVAISAISNTIIFYCFSTPTLSFTNIVENQVIESPTYVVNMAYSQLEGEELQEYCLYLYNASLNEIYASGVKYDTDLSVRIDGLMNSTMYYVRAVCKTSNGMEVDTGYVKITVRYLYPTLMSRLGLENRADEGYVTITSNIIAIDGEAEVSPVVYVNNTSVDLLSSNSISLTATPLTSFRLDVIYNLVTLNKPLLTLTDYDYVGRLYYREGVFESQNNALKGYFEFIIDGTNGNYCVQSDYFTPIDYVYFNGYVRDVLTDFTRPVAQGTIPYGSLPDDKKLQRHRVTLIYKDGLYSLSYVKD